MSIMKARTQDSGFTRAVSQGDLLGAAEIVSTLTTAGAGTLTGAVLATNILNRTGPGGAFNDTTDTASNIIAAIGQCQAGDSWRLRYINTVAFVSTLVAGVGVTLAGITTTAASSVKEFLVQVTNATPQSIVAGGTSTVTPRVLTGMTLAQTSAISQGMLVTGAGIGASAKVVSIQPGVGVTVDVDSTATASLVAITFSPTVTITSLGQMLL